MLFKKYESNLVGNDYVFGDIHGMYDYFKYCLKKLNFDKTKDRVFCLGDLIDRGNENLEMLALLNEKWFYSIIGNHEQMFMEYMLGEIDSYAYYYNGGEWTNKYTHEELMPYYYLVYKLPLVIQVGNVGLVHGDINYTYWDDFINNLYNNYENCIWGKNRISRNIYNNIIGIDKVILGHTVLSYPTELGNTLYIDTGGVFKQRLTCYNINSSELTSFEWKDYLNNK